jgi:DNA-binding MarR family transcriptional regulator
MQAGTSFMSVETLASTKSCTGLKYNRCNDYSEGVKHSLQADIKQSKPFGSLEEEVFTALLRTADRMEARAAEVLKAYELSPTQYNALRILRGAEPDGLACNEVASRMLTHDPDITRLMARLERRGLARRERAQSDRRVVTTRITPAGLQVVKGLDATVDGFLKQLLGGLGEQRLKSLLRLLQAVRKHSA